MADTTKISFTCNPLMELLALQGLRFEVGGISLEYAPLNNTDVTFDGTLGWRKWGLVENGLKLLQTLGFYEGEVGQVGKIMTTLETSRKMEADVSLTCATFQGAKFALGSNSATIVEPTVPVTTTIDETPAAATNLSVVVASVSGFAANDEIGIVTGTSTYGTDEEFKIIRSIDAATKTIYLVEPLDQLPADGATVRVIKRKRLTVKPCDMPAECQFRMIKYNRSYSNRLRVFHGLRAAPKDPQGIDDGDWKVAAKYMFKLNVMPAYNIGTGDFSFITADWINP
jgi:hypothetical protein